MRLSTTGHPDPMVGYPPRTTGDAVGRWRTLLVALPLPVLPPLAALGVALLWPQLRLAAAFSAAPGGTPSPVSTVAQLERAVAQDPAGWDGRTVLVRGRAVRSQAWQAPDSLVTQIALVDAEGAAGTRPLSVAWGGPDPLLAALRRLPLIGAAVPPPQRLRWGTMAVYRVQLGDRSGRAPCGAGAVLLDADPDAP